MYKNLNPASLGVTGRQSELIELALTYGFRGLDVDAAELLKRAALQGIQEAAKYVWSGKVKVGGWTLPINLAGDKEAFRSELEKLAGMADLARQVGFSYCVTVLEAGSDSLPYHENYELHRDRLSKAADVLAQHEIRLAVGFKAAAEFRQGRTFQFIHQAEEMLTFLRTAGSSNLGLALDTWNWKVGGGAADQLGELSGKQVVCVTIADLPSEADPATVEAPRRLLPGDETQAEHAALLKNLAKRGFEGPVTLASHASQAGGATRDAIVEKCAGILDRIWTAAGLSKAGRLTLAATEA
jgi:sugar phosphate isomerase/epimerase